MSDILTKIEAYKREEIAAAKRAHPLAGVEARAKTAPPPRGFVRAIREKLAHGDYALIAEVKKASPSRGLIREDFDPPALARAYQAGGAACLSVLTDTPSFQGADDDLGVARMGVELPCLRKEFLVDPWQVAESRALGADAVLVILAMVDDTLASDLVETAHAHGMDVLVEVHDAAEMARAAGLKANLVGVNNRDLRTFEVDLTVTERLAAAAPAGALLVTESGIFGPADV